MRMAHAGKFRHRPKAGDTEMMKAVTAEEMRAIDKSTIEGYGIPGQVLMERAGCCVAARVKELFGQRKVIVLAGGGNNGGDGLVAARQLFNDGWKVMILLIAKESKLSPDCLFQYRAVKKLGIAIEFRSRIEPKDLHGALLIDALFGTGLSKTVTGPVAEMIRLINRTDVPVISVDIPSGISADDGRILGEAVKADVTITFGLPKIGHYLYPGAEYAGRLFVEDIGFPRELTNSDRIKAEVVVRQDTALLVPERPVFSHKGDYGHVLILAGSRGKTGAAIMAARACMRAGAGMVTLGVPESIAASLQSVVVEEMLLPLPDDGSGVFSEDALAKVLSFIAGRVDVCAIGPGIRVTPGTRSLVSGLISVSTVPLVADADAINALQGNMSVLKTAKSPVILTPHIGEMSRLIEVKRTELLTDLVGAARRFSSESGTYLVLKGAPTLIASPEDNIFINTTGNPGMATAGAGDVLTGMIAGLLGQNMNPLDAALLGVYLHGLAGDIAAADRGMHSLIAGDIIASVPAAFLALGRA
ncbi:MAG: bifunctional ADP-dependent NAD(P)H-hydrate dehydratase/NAD(P)H-hydrate epimerase [Thermodesulfovibrio sp.]|nr:bifunctional ADP-dependent NAD(P)H-hydrate dehydratase/NAD(P)H-hydrate epimerase [Thermodesulfovibrio sp.]